MNIVTVRLNKSIMIPFLIFLAVSCVAPKPVAQATLKPENKVVKPLKKDTIPVKRTPSPESVAFKLRVESTMFKADKAFDQLNKMYPTVEGLSDVSMKILKQNLEISKQNTVLFKRAMIYRQKSEKADSTNNILRQIIANQKITDKNIADGFSEAKAAREVKAKERFDDAIISWTAISILITTVVHLLLYLWRLWRHSKVSLW